MEIDNRTEIKAEFLQRKNQLEQQIDHLDNFITDLTSHKISLENANRHIEHLITLEKDQIKKSKYFHAIRNNIELLTKVFNSISEIESIKHRYYKEINEITISKFKLIDVDIRRINEKIRDGGQENLSVFFEKLKDTLSGSKISNKEESNLNKDPEYKL